MFLFTKSDNSIMSQVQKEALKVWFNKYFKMEVNLLWHILDIVLLISSIRASKCLQCAYSKANSTIYYHFTLQCSLRH
jgi:hypothetical protein